MKFFGKVQTENGTPEFVELAIQKILSLEGKDIEIDIRTKKDCRSSQQNRALHLLFKKLAIELNNAGYDMRKTLKQDVEIPWNTELVKEFLWRPVQGAMTQIESTTKLDTKTMNDIYDVLNREMAKRGIHVPFPSEKELEMEMRGYKVC